MPWLSLYISPIMSCTLSVHVWIISVQKNQVIFTLEHVIFWIGGGTESCPILGDDSELVLHTGIQVVNGSGKRLPIDL